MHVDRLQQSSHEIDFVASLVGVGNTGAGGNKNIQHGNIRVDERSSGVETKTVRVKAAQVYQRPPPSLQASRSTDHGRNTPLRTRDKIRNS